MQIDLRKRLETELKIVRPLLLFASWLLSAVLIHSLYCLAFCDPRAM